MVYETTPNDRWQPMGHIYSIDFQGRIFLILTSLLFEHDYEYDEKFSNFSVV